MPVRAEVELMQHGKGVVACYLPLPNLPGEVHSRNEFALEAPVAREGIRAVLPLRNRMEGWTSVVSLRYVIEEDGTSARFEPVAAPS